RLQKFNITLRTYKEISDDEMSSEALAKQKNEAEVFHKEFFEAMDTDFNSVKAIGYLFGMINYFQKILNTNQPIASSVKKQLINDLNDIESFFNCLTPEEQVLTKEVDSEWKDRLGKLVEAILKSRKAQKKAKNWAMADALRDILSESNIVVNDNGNDYSWEFKK
ncbi:MAG: DALR domain-containing protein, partial [Promethearchaeota archaeon]